MVTAKLTIAPNPDDSAYGKHSFEIQFPDDDMFIVDSVKHGLAAMIARQLGVIDHIDSNECEWYIKLKDQSYKQLPFYEAMDELD